MKTNTVCKLIIISFSMLSVFTNCIKSDERDVNIIESNKQEMENEIGDKEEVGEIKTKKQSIYYNIALKDQELLDSIVVNAPEKIQLRSKYKIGELGEKEITTYIMQGYEKNEFESSKGKEMILYNPIEQNTYQYNNYSTDGWVYSGNETFTGITKSIENKDYFLEEGEVLITAEITELNDATMLYIEAIDNSEDSGVVYNKKWISVEYAYPVKFESYINNELIYRMEVIEIDYNSNIDINFFVPPSDVEFDNHQVSKEYLEKIRKDDNGQME